ncbi:GFA family protein [Nostoc sp. 'Lobaria pulmonaria (5183) cyanobiont']|uniref:GFA family protein n=1 Tax=Nostoc sp. 'Lobaria pulmonaria (5183) cyanobiont' TaxID=1618022 RepID=UPI000CF34E02|nr:GFA family protein [Nostoc sp. 'Lobaria pulmonaria (5183) cyanobiont']AVH69024.1 glutathione-dependent formaldehyde-activating enzyme [Nostoc sp. 'Lobaria pulmonaria (5183) cyanobiont']
MNLPYTGGCQCGHIRYEIHAQPLTLYLCHCKECQKQSSSAFGMSLTVLRDAVVIVQGKPKAWTRKNDSGREVNNLFCGDCGTRLFHERTYKANTINVKAGTLDDTSWLRPVGNIWTRSAQSWVIISDKLLNYDGQPEDTQALWEKWKQQHP